MKMKRNPITNAIQKALFAGFVASSAFGTVALAQDSDDGEDVEKQDKITVVGSHIKRTDIEGVSPVLTIEREDLENSGFSSVADILRSNAFNSFGSARESSGNSGQGQATLNLRGIGSGRTLILVNGRRIPGSPVLDGQVQNLNTIPFAAVESIDVMTDGASAIYGADAIGGVVNIKLRNDFEGATANFKYDSPERDGGQSKGGSFIVGGSSDKARFTMSVEKDEKDILFSRDRDFLRNTLTGSDPNSYWDYSEVSINSRTILNGSGYMPMIQGNPGDDVCSVYGDGFLPNIVALAPWGSTCVYDYTAISAETASLDRLSFFATGEYDINDSLTVFGQVISTRVESFGRYAPVASGRLTWDGPDLPETQIQYNGQTYTLNPLMNGDNYFYRFNFLNPRDTTQVDYQMDAQLGVKGFNAGIDWQVAYQYDIYDMQEWGDGYVNAQGLTLAGVNGWDPRHPDQTGLYSQFVAQMRENANRRAQMELQRLEFGGQFDAGPVAMYVGGEYRTEDYRDQTQAQNEAGLIRGTAGSSAAGDRTAKALFAEAILPVADVLEFTGALRWDNYSDFGSNVSGKLGVRYDVTDNIMLRATYGTGFKAPSLSALYQSDSFSAVSGKDITSCVNAGTSFADCRSRQYDTYFVSNQNLDPEKSTQYLFGGAIDFSDWVGFDLSASLDYYYTEVEDVVGTVSGTGLFFAEYAGLLPALQAINSCYAVERDANGIHNRSTACAINFGEFNTSGIDFKWRTAFDMGGAGLLSFEHQLNYVLEYNSVDYVSGPLVNAIDRRGLPKFRTNFALDWSIGDHSVALYSYYIPSQEEESVPNNGFNITNPSTYYNVGIGEVDSYWNHNLSYTYSAPWSARIQVGVTNLMDEDPVLDDDNVTDSSLYPFKGRAYFLSYTQDF